MTTRVGDGVGVGVVVEFEVPLVGVLLTGELGAELMLPGGADVDEVLLPGNGRHGQPQSNPASEDYRSISKRGREIPVPKCECIYASSELLLAEADDFTWCWRGRAGGRGEMSGLEERDLGGGVDEPSTEEDAGGGGGAVVLPGGGGGALVLAGGGGGGGASHDAVMPVEFEQSPGTGAAPPATKRMAAHCNWRY